MATEKEYRDMIEMLLGCLANQKFVNEAPSCGDEMDMAINEPEKYKNKKQEIQAGIDYWYKKGWELLDKTSPAHNAPEGERG